MARIIGSVSDTEGAALSGASVKVLEGGRLIASDTIGEDGKLKIEDLEQNRKYNLNVVFEGKLVYAEDNVSRSIVRRYIRRSGVLLNNDAFDDSALRIRLKIG